MAEAQPEETGMAAVTTDEAAPEQKSRERRQIPLFTPAFLPGSLVRIALGILVLGGMTTGAFFVITDVIGPRLGPAGATEARGTAIDPDVPAGADLPGEQFSVDEIVINPAGTRGKRFLRVGVALETRGGPDTLAELDARKAQIRDLLIRKFSARTLDEVADPLVREEIRLSCIAEINAALVTGELSNLYFTDYVLQ
jgi:flagellar basal body-associated protein FliL